MKLAISSMVIISLFGLSMSILTGEGSWYFWGILLWQAVLAMLLSVVIEKKTGGD